MSGRMQYVYMKGDVSMGKVTHGESGWQTWGCRCVACVRGHNRVLRAASERRSPRPDRRPMPKYSTGEALTKGEYERLTEGRVVARRGVPRRGPSSGSRWA